MERILVPCDFSEQASHAFRTALSFADKAAEIHLLHVIELPVLHDAVLMPVLSYEEDIFREIEQKAVTAFAKMLVNEQVEGRHVTSKVVYGGTSRMILDYVRDHEIDLVIMGTKGATGMKEFVVGSNTEKIVRGASVPVLAVRSAIAREDIKDIVFPNTLQTENQEDLVMHVKALQDFFKARLHIVWINTPTHFESDSTTRRRLTRFCERFMLANYTINIYNDLLEEQGVINFPHSIEADLVAMGTHGRRGLAHVFAGSVTEDVVNHIDIPIWTYTLT